MWVLYVFVGVALIILVGYIWKLTLFKKKQWTHKLKIRRVSNSGQLSDSYFIRMKRFPLIKNASVFELEKPFLGSFLIPELDSYTGLNQFSVIIDNNNRIYINNAEKFCPESSSVIVSAKHAGIDLAFDDLKSDWQNINKTSKRIEWSQIIKSALWGLLIIAIMVVTIKGIGQWGENHKIDAQKSAAEAEAMRSLSEAMKTSQATMNTQALILDLLKENYGTNNIQKIIKEKTNVALE